MPLDTQLPEWISRSWAPRETFDPTPWLQERYRRQVQAQVLPLEIQGMALQNQAQQLHIEQQAMQNEQAGMEMQDYKTQLPVFQEAYKATGGNVKALLDSPVPAGVTHPKLVQMWLNAQHSAANTTLGQSYMQDQIELTKSANALVNAGGDPMPAYIEGPNGPEGPHRIDREALAKQWEAVGAEKEAAALRRIKAQRAGAGSALVANMGLLETYEQEYADALDLGDLSAADAAQKKIELVHDTISRTHRDVRLESEIRLNERLINTLTAKISSEIIPSKKAEMQTRLDAATKRYQELIATQGPATPAPAALPPVGGRTNYIWTPQGTKPK